jgi:endonuclease I
MDFIWRYLNEKTKKNNQMKKNYSFLLLLIATIGYAQAPAGYYNSATGTGYTLKTQLYNIIRNHNDRSYAGLYTTYQTSDKKANGKVWDMYSNCDFTFGTVAEGGNQDNGTNAATECVFFNREHTVPQSYFGNGATPMYSDAHFVLPTDKVVNARRDDYPFGVVQNATWTSQNGSKLGNNLNSGYSAGYSSTVFEPIDEYKGDFARLLFYFATRYENLLAGFYTSSSSTSKAMFDGSSDRAFSPTFLNILLTWNQQDPVSAKEIARNNAIYARQNNRNPYIDNNAYVTMVWGTPLAVPVYESLAAVNVYPNPSTNHKINIDTELQLDEIQLININGQIMQQIKNPASQGKTYTLENLPSGFYFLKLTSDSQSATKKVIVN